MFWYELIIGLFFLALIAGLGWILSLYLNFLFRDGSPMGRLDRPLLHAFGIFPAEQHWRDYLASLLWFHAIGFIVLFLLLLLQNYLPWNPRNFPGVPWPIALHTAASFVTNTNLQAYSGEISLSYFSQSVGLAVQQFLSAAAGLSVAVVLVRSFARESAQQVGNFWQDMMRGTLWLLLPLSIVLAFFLLAQGVPQNWNDYILVMPPFSDSGYLLPQGPVASQTAIKMLGSNGGGFFGANAAHPYENPGIFSNYIQLITILLLPIALLFYAGHQLQKPREGWALFAVTTLLFAISFGVILHTMYENPAWLQNAMAGGNFTEPLSFEGREYGFGTLGTAFWAAATTATSNGSANMAVGSLSPLAIFIMLVQMQLGEVMYGGIGAGLYTLILFALLAIFIAALMIGRSAEFWSKKIEVREIKIGMFSILSVPLTIFTALSISLFYPGFSALMLNNGASGFTEALYAYSSAAANNGSAMAGFNMGGDAFVTLMLTVAMLLGRFVPIACVLAIAGSVAAKKKLQPSAATLPTDSPTFVFMLCGVILLMGALTYFPVLSLSSIADYLMVRG